MWKGGIVMERSQLNKAIQRIRKAGFSHLKVELEAQFGRAAVPAEECLGCNGEGYNFCPTCSGLGMLAREEGDGLANCEACSGEGFIGDCADCDRRGVRQTVQDLEWCRDFIRERVSEDARNSLEFDLFYRDGSCDSEYTFTIPTEAAIYLPEFVRAFAKLGKLTGETDIRGAGVHIATMTQSGYPYERQLPQAKVQNFTRQVTKLMPALFFLGSAGNRSRSLRYRWPRIHSYEKYSAIYTRGNTLFEFRIFEPCYRHPDRILDYVETIGSTMKYYTNTRARVKEIGKRFKFPRGQSVRRFFFDPEQLEVLDKQLKYFDMSKSVDELKRERRLNYTPKQLELRRQAKQKLLESKFERFYANPPLYESYETDHIIDLYSRQLPEHTPNELRAMLVREPKEFWKKAFEVENVPQPEHVITI